MKPEQADEATYHLGVASEFTAYVALDDQGSRDALHFTPAEWASLTLSKLNRAKQDRIAAHKAAAIIPTPDESPEEARIRLRRERADQLRAQATTLVAQAEAESALADIDEVALDKATESAVAQED